MSYISSGAAAVDLGMKYSVFVRAIKGRSDLPGMVRIGPNAGFDRAKLAELRAVLIAEGWLPAADQDERLVPAGGAECLA